MTKALISLTLAALASNAFAGAPSSDDLAACQTGVAQGTTLVTPIPFQFTLEEDSYGNGYTATTVAFKRNTMGYARKAGEEGIAFNRRVYPLKQAKPINVSQSEYNNLLQRGSIGVIGPADWFWLKGPQQFLCIVTNRSMEKGTPVLFLLSMNRIKQVYVAWGTTPSR